MGSIRSLKTKCAPKDWRSWFRWSKSELKGLLNYVAPCPLMEPELDEEGWDYNLSRDPRTSDHTQKATAIQILPLRYVLYKWLTVLKIKGRTQLY